MNNFFNEIINLYIEKKMPPKIMLSGKKGLGKATFAYHIINYILSTNEEFKYDSNNFIINENNKSFKLGRMLTKNDNFSNTDLDAIRNNKISITPLSLDITNLDRFNFLIDG